MGGCISGANNVKINTRLDEKSDFYIDLKLKKYISKSRISLNSSTKLCIRNKCPLQALYSTEISDITFIDSVNDITSLREICEIFD
jgi:hypothetical protein